MFYGKITRIRDVVTFQGQGAEELVQAFRDSVDDYLAFCRERKEGPNTPVSGHFIVRCSKELHRQVTNLAATQGISLNQWVIYALEREAIEEKSSLLPVMI